MRTPVVLNGISYRHGSWHELADLVVRGLAEVADIKTLTVGGLQQYSVIERPVHEYYRECVTESLDKAAVDPADVDAVIFMSSSFSSYENQSDLIDLGRELGMIKALPMGMFGAQCCNFSYALMTAQSLIDAQGMRSVLLLGSDALDERRASRLLPGNAGVFSDTVFSCLVSASPEAGPPAGFAVEHVTHAVDPELSALDPQNDLVTYLYRFSRVMKTLCAQTYASTGRDAGEFSHLVLANLATSVLKNYAALAGVPFSRVPTGNAARFGHCFAYDQLITLSALAECGEMVAGDAAHVLAVGATYLFNSTVLRML
jgi:3-oxoacyl-[acyl-carrier-protein] synthase-3